MDISVAKTLYASIDAALVHVLSNGTTKVMAGLAALIGTFWTLSLVVRSLQWLWMGMTQIFRDVVFELLKMAFVTAMAFNVAWYLATVVPFVTEFPTWMGGLLSSQIAGQAANVTQVNQIDTLIGTYLTELQNLVKAMKFQPFSNTSATFLGILGVLFYLSGGIPFLLVAVATSMVLKVATTVFLAVGPLFIAFALFDQTRQYFWGWVSVVAGFMLTHVLFAVVLALEVGLVNSTIIKNGQIDTSLPGTLSILIIFCTFTVLATELPGYAAAVMGGAGSGTSSIGGIMAKASGVGTALRMTKAAGKLVGKARNRIGGS